MIFWQLLDWLRHQARLRHWDAGLAWGRRGEDLAHRYLRRQGYTIVARNYRTRSGSGEVDLIGWDGDVLAFVEVKTRATDEFGDPERAVDHDKRHHLRVAARDYVRRSGGDWAMARFDVLSVVLTHPPRITLLKDAFEKSEAAVRGAL